MIRITRMKLDGVERSSPARSWRSKTMSNHTRVREPLVTGPDVLAAMYQGRYREAPLMEPRRPSATHPATGRDAGPWRARSGGAPRGDAARAVVVADLAGQGWAHTPGR